MVETEFEILRISKPVSLPLEGLDFVYEALDGAAGDAMLEVVEKSSPCEQSLIYSQVLRAGRN